MTLLMAKDERGVCTLTLNRPEKHNAFDDALIAELTARLESLAEDAEVRIVVLTGAGDSFSAGADLTWMQSMIQYDMDTNCHDAMRLAGLMRALYNLPKPTVARVNGGAFGGGLGLIACCDIAVGLAEAKFGFTESTLGIAPAVIAPFVISAIGARQAKRLFLTGEIFSGWEAQQLGLLARAVAPAELDEAVEREIKLLLRAGAQAQKACKELVHYVANIQDHVDFYTSHVIAELRVSDEGQEGLRSFIEKRPPAWRKS